MTHRLALLRPEPGWSASATAARALGLAVIGHPLSEAEPIDWTMPEGTFDALLVGSGAVFRHGGESLRGLRHLPVYAVGDATADAARAAGFSVARTGEGGLQQVLDAATGGRRAFLRLGGEDRVGLALRDGQSLTEVAVYRLRTLPLGADFAAELRGEPAVIALHSSAAARHFGEECDRLGIARSAHGVLALGSRIAAAAGQGWKAIHIAARPTDAALLAKAAALCK